MSVPALKVTTSKAAPRVLREVKAQTQTVSDDVRAELVMSNRAQAMTLARSIVSKWRSKIELSEMQSIVDVSLCEAAARFKPSTGATFMTFFYYHLKGNLVKTVVSRADQRLVFVESYDRKLTFATHDEDSADVWSAKLGATLDPQSNAQGPDAQFEQKQLVQVCSQLCRKLRGLEREVIWRTYFESKEPGELTREMGVTRGHLSRVRKTALEKIRRRIDG